MATPTDDSDGNILSLDPAINDTLAGTIAFSFKKMMQNTDGMLPAQIVSYDRATNRATVTILIARLTTNGSLVSRSMVASVPVLLLGGGGYMISFPLTAGNFGWIIANDRDISNFLADYEESAPATLRIKSFNDGLFIPDAMTGYTINPVDADNAVIQSLDGTIKIALTPLGVVITGGVTVTGGISASGGSGSYPVQLSGNILLTGNLAVSGNITAGGTITPDTPPPP